MNELKAGVKCGCTVHDLSVVTFSRGDKLSMSLFSGSLKEKILFVIWVQIAENDV